MTTNNPKRPKKLLAISSGGGHWVQLLRLRPAFEGCEMTFATVDSGYELDVKGAGFYVVSDCNRGNWLMMARTIFGVLKLIIRSRPDVVVSTGSAPGFFGLVAGKIFGARTVWVDSIANGSELSLSGRKAGRFADLWLTQWPELARDGGPHFKGSVL